MPLIRKYSQRTEGGPWFDETYFVHPEYLQPNPAPAPAYAEVHIHDYMGFKWSSAAHILEYLLTQHTLRRRILKEVAYLTRFQNGQQITIAHPLLQLPLYLHQHDDDDDFRTQILHYLEIITDTYPDDPVD